MNELWNFSIYKYLGKNSLNRSQNITKLTVGNGSFSSSSGLEELLLCKQLQLGQ